MLCTCVHFLHKEAWFHKVERMHIIYGKLQFFKFPKLKILETSIFRFFLKLNISLIYKAIIVIYGKYLQVL